LLNEAKYLLSKNISIIPIKGRTGIDEADSKKPILAWKEYQDRLPRLDEVEFWFSHSKHNMAMVTGPISKVLVLDIDNKRNGLDSLKGKFIPSTWEDSSPNGKHFYFQWTPTLKDKVTNDSDLLPGVDIRGEGGYVITAPSIGYSGTPYRWVKHPKNTLLAYPPAWLISLLKTRGAAKELVSGNPHGWIADTLKGLERGAPRHKSLIKVAGRLWHDGYSPSDITEILKLHVLSCGLTLDNFQKSIIEQIQKYERNIEDDKEDRVLNLKDLMKDDIEDVVWLINKVLPIEGTLILGGKQGIGKSFLALDLCLEMSIGGKWLNKFAVTQAPTLYIDEENGASLLKQRLKAMMKAKGMSHVPENLHLCIEHNYKLDLEKSVARLKRKIEKVNPKLVVLDSLRRFHNKNENDSGEVSALFETIKKMARLYGCAFVVLDHERKSNPAIIGKNDASSDDLRGSNDKGAAADAVISLKEDKGQLNLWHTKARHSRPFLPILVKIEDNEENKTIEVKGY
jgi:hypothetical protein